MRVVREAAICFELTSHRSPRTVAILWRRLSSMAWS
jgi:hypothetical protein